MLDDEEQDDLSPEAEIAMMTALQVLSPVSNGEKQVRPSELDATGMVEIADAAVGQFTPVDEELDNIRSIRSRNDIPLAEKHVLVMWGLSTYCAEHPMGATFVVDNSRYNRARDQQYREAISSAIEMAQTKGLPFIYLLD